jgi:hypothetical protein
MCFEIVSERFQDRGMNATHNENLFRKQALRSLSEKKPGPPICLAPRPWAWLSGLTTLLFVSTADGWFQSKVLCRFTNRASAVVRRVVHQPGDQVKEGEALGILEQGSTLPEQEIASQQRKRKRLLITVLPENAELVAEVFVP